MNKLSFASAAILGLASAVQLQANTHAHAQGGLLSKNQAGQEVSDLAQFDVDGDGMVSREEFEAYGDALFEHVDADGDGAVFIEELEEYHEKATAPEPEPEEVVEEEVQEEEEQVPVEEEKPSEDQLPDEEPKFTEEEVEETEEKLKEEVAERSPMDEFKDVDENGDGLWELQEVINYYTDPEWWGEHFDRADADGSQTMDITEFSSWFHALDFEAIGDMEPVEHVGNSTDGAKEATVVDEDPVLEHEVEVEADVENLDTQYQESEISDLEWEILAVLNQYRADPTSAIPYIQAEYDSFMEDGMTIDTPSGPNLLTWEGKDAWQEAIDFCNTQPAVGPLEMHHPLWEAAMSHVLDQGPTGQFGHDSTNGDSFDVRVTKYFTENAAIGENISYGTQQWGHNAEAVIAGLLVDDGVPSRGHRINLFSETWNRAGIACGYHAELQSMCVQNYASEALW